MASHTRRECPRLLALVAEPGMWCVAIWVAAIVFVRLLDGSMSAVVVLLWSTAGHLVFGALCVFMKRRLPQRATGLGEALAARVTKAGGDPVPEMPIVIGPVEEELEAADAEPPRRRLWRGFQQSFMENPGYGSRLAVSCSLAGAVLALQGAIWLRVGGYADWSMGTRGAVASTALVLAAGAVIALASLALPRGRAGYPTAWRVERSEPRLLTPALWLPLALYVVFSQLAIHAASLHASASRLVVVGGIWSATLAALPALASSPTVEAVESWISQDRRWRVYRSLVALAWAAARVVRAMALAAGVIAIGIGAAALSLPSDDAAGAGVALTELGLMLAGLAAMLGVTRAWRPLRSPDLLRARTLASALDGTALERRAQLATFFILPTMVGLMLAAAAVVE